MVLKAKVQQGPKYQSHCVTVNSKFKVMVIKRAEEINNYTMLWKFHIVEQNV
jgi:hypothetical protein